MTAKNRTNLKAVFETGDTPDGDDFADLIDSAVSIADTSAQSMSSDLTVPNLNATTKVSAGSGTFTGTVSANAVSVSGNVSAETVTVGGNASVSAAVTAGSIVSLGGVTVSAAVTAGSIVNLGALTMVTAQTTASASAGGGIAVPASAAKWLIVTVSGVKYSIPLFPQ